MSRLVEARDKTSCWAVRLEDRPSSVGRRQILELSLTRVFTRLASGSSPASPSMASGSPPASPSTASGSSPVSSSTASGSNSIGAVADPQLLGAGSEDCRRRMSARERARATRTWSSSDSPEEASESPDATSEPPDAAGLVRSWSPTDLTDAAADRAGEP